MKTSLPEEESRHGGRDSSWSRALHLDELLQAQGEMPKVANVEHGVHTLLIHQAFTTPTDAGGTRHYELMQHAMRRGHHFSVITSDFGYLSGRRHAAALLGRRENADGIAVVRVATPPLFHGSKLGQLITFLSFTVSSFFAALRVRDVDLVMATTPPIFQALAALGIAKVRRRPLLLEIRDLWPEFIIDMGQLKNPLVIRIARGLERLLYRHADHFVVNSPAYVGYLESKGVARGRIALVPNGVDAALFAEDASSSASAASLRRELGLDEKFVVMYAGAMGPANDIGMILDAAASLRDRSDVHFVLVGGGKLHEQLKTRAAQLHLANVTFAGPQPKSRMKAYLAAADLCVASLQNIAMFRMTYPNKVFDYMAAGKPIALAIDGVIRDVVDAAGAGRFTPPGDASALARAITEMAHDRDECSAMGLRGQSYVRQHFDRRQHAETFSTLLRDFDASTPAVRWA